MNKVFAIAVYPEECADMPAMDYDAYPIEVGDMVIARNRYDGLVLEVGDRVKIEWCHVDKHGVGTLFHGWFDAGEVELILKHAAII